MLVEHQPYQVIILTVHQRQRQQFVDGHDLRVTQGSGKHAAVIGHRGLKPGPGRTLHRHQHRIAESDFTDIGPDVALAVRHRDLADLEPSDSLCRAGNQLDLCTATRSGTSIQLNRRHQFPSLGRLAGKLEANHRRSLHTHRSLVDGRSIRVLPKSRILDDLLEQHVRLVLEDQARPLPDDEVPGVAVTGIGHNQRHHDGTGRPGRLARVDLLVLGTGCDLQPHCLGHKNRPGRFHPPGPAALLANQADGVEYPQSSLPFLHRFRQGLLLSRLRLAPTTSQFGHQQR